MTEIVHGSIHALLIDDHALFREAVAGALHATPDLRVEHCGSIREALPILERDHFDLVLLDHDLGNERASQFLPAARQAGYEGAVLIVTAWVSDTEARRLMRQGVAGIFLKEAPLSSLIESIRPAAQGPSPGPGGPFQQGNRVAHADLRNPRGAVRKTAPAANSSRLNNPAL
jgi:DNA-binding NarL/FixJ family response regulator